MKNIGLMITLLSLFSSMMALASGNLHSNYDMREKPQDVKVVTRLIGDLNWGGGSYYEFELVVRGEIVASTTTIPERTLEKRKWIQGIINQAIA
jgi:hypothetical protein